MAGRCIGLGTIGRTIAQHLIEEGEELLIWNRTISKAEGLGAGFGHDQAHGGAVGELRGVARGDGAVAGIEHGLELGQALQGGLGTDHLVVVEGPEPAGRVVVILLDRELSGDGGTNRNVAKREEQDG